MRLLQASDHVVVVGAGLAGWRFVEALRREGFQGDLTLIGDELDVPYDRPPLSKNVLVGKWDLEKATLATDALLKEANIELRLGQGATSLDVANATVQLADGTAVPGDRIVIATGTRARRLAFSADHRLHVIRRLEDIRVLNQSLATLEPNATIAIIGGGFIGAETATALHTRGFHTVVLEAAPRPLLGVLGEDVSTWLLGLARNVGVELRVNQKIKDVVEQGEGLRVVFDDGSSLDAGVVIEGVGVETNVEWLATSGLEIDNGVVVDEYFMAAERVAAIGDVARFSWPSVTGTELVRIEHWEVANGHASTLAKMWVTGETPDDLMVPYFWSDQYGKKIQLLGHPRAGDDVLRVSGSDEELKWIGLFSRDGVVTGVVTLNNPRGLMLSKPLLERPISLASALDKAPWSS
jgi:3-phenylpropionate/trans-cinnamate dioxygenase ferredoxin reductase component